MNQISMTTVVELDEACNVSSESLEMTVTDVPQYGLILFNQSVSSNPAGNVSVGEEIVLELTIDFPNGTEDVLATFVLTDEQNNVRVQPVAVSTFGKGDNLALNLPVVWQQIAGRFVFNILAGRLAEF